MKQFSTKMIAALLAKGYLTRPQLHRVKELQAQTACSLGKALWSLNLVSKTEFLILASAVTNLPTLTEWLKSSGNVLDFSLAKAFKTQELIQCGFFPCHWQPETNHLVVVVTEADNQTVHQTIQRVWQQAQVQEILATEDQLLNLIVEKNLQNQLLQEGQLTLAQWQEAQALHESTGSSLGSILTRLSYLRPIDYLQTLSQLTDFPIFSHLVGTDFLSIDSHLIQSFDPQVLIQDLFFPIAWLNDHTIMVMVQDPLDLEVETKIYAQNPGVEIVKVLGTESDITVMVDRFYRKDLTQKAIYQLLARSPKESAARVFTAPQILLGYIGFLALWAGLIANWQATLVFLLIAVNFFFVVSILFKFSLSMIGSFEQTRQITDQNIAELDNQSLPVYTILVPVYNEPEVIPILLKALSQLDYPQEKLDVLLLLEEKDLVTIEAARAANPPRYVRFIYIPDSQPKTKPKACNYGLAFARGDYLTIYDAEDIPDPDQLKKAILAFKKGSKSLVCVQAALNYFNRDENFLTRMFTLEYSYWFDYLLPGLEALGLPIPLGGTSNHFRTDRLRELGAWDPFNVTEDADLGIRASQRGYTVGVINSTTYEEANCRFKNWIRQRSRWIKGYMQTWLVHNRHPYKSLKTLGLKNWLSYQFFIGGHILGFLCSPILWLLLLAELITQANFIEKLLPSWMIYISLFNLIFGNAIGIYLNMIAMFRRKYYKLSLYALLNPLYWQLHSMAAYMALWQLFTKPFYWEKTLHGISKFTKPSSVKMST